MDTRLTRKPHQDTWSRDRVNTVSRESLSIMGMHWVAAREGHSILFALLRLHFDKPMGEAWEVKAVACIKHER